MKSQKSSSSAKAAARKSPAPVTNPELVIITGLSGSGKGTVLKALEDFGYYSVDNLPVDLIPKFAELTRESPKVRSAALVVDIREGGQALAKFPQILKKVRKSIATRLVFLEADDDTLVRRFSETRRPHPLGRDLTVAKSVQEERKEMAEIRDLADFVVNTAKLNVHQLRELIQEKFHGPRDESKLQIYVTSFGFRHGVPTDSDLVFDVRFLPNPNYIPEFKPLTGLQPKVAKYIRGYPQTVEFLKRISELLVYLIPHYIAEGKSYLTISFGCTGGHHRSVMMAHEIKQHLARQGYRVKESHRDIEKAV